MSIGIVEPQDHVDAIYRAADKLRGYGQVVLASHAEIAAEAFIDLQTDFDDILAALVGLVQEKQLLGIERETYQTALALVIKHFDFGDSPEEWAARKVTQLPEAA